MTKEEAKAAEQSLRAAGWNVIAQESIVRGWCLVAEPADGGPGLFGFSHNDMKVLILGGQVAHLSFRVGDRVKRADWRDGIHAYATMEGTVTDVTLQGVMVQWDMDQGHPPSGPYCHRDMLEKVK